MSQNDDKKTSRMRPGIRILLIASLAANLIIAGLVVGAAVSNSRSGPSDKPVRGGDLIGAFTQALDKDERRELGRNIRDHHAGQSDRGRPRIEARAMIAAIKAQPFDPSAIEALIQQQAEEATERRVIAQQIWLEYVSEMTDAERADYADRIVETLSQRRGPPRKP